MEDEKTVEEAWINGPVGSTVRRGLAFVLPLIALVLNKTLHLDMTADTQMVIAGLVMTYVAQSVYHSGQKVKASAPLEVPAVKGSP